jgi:hypothetical protein
MTDHEKRVGHVNSNLQIVDSVVGGSLLADIHDPDGQECPSSMRSYVIDDSIISPFALVLLWWNQGQRRMALTSPSLWEGRPASGRGGRT